MVEPIQIAQLISQQLVKDSATTLYRLVHERFAKDPERAATLAEAEERPDDPDARERLTQDLNDVIVVDKDFAGSLTQLIASSETNVAAPTTAADVTASVDASRAGPVRGFPGLTVATASVQTTAGSDFSIFVLVQNPFDVPITVNEVQTHIPVELLDVNMLRARIAKQAEPEQDIAIALLKRWRRFVQGRQLRREHPGVATAVGTDFTPEVAKELFRNEVAVHRDLIVASGSSASFAAVSIALPKGASSDEMDAIMRRIVDYRRGVIPVRLQPGDSVVRQFVLRTRSRVLFRPLSHTFQIQVNYSVDGVDHTGTIPYQLSIQAALGSIAWGSLIGAALGTVVKTFSQAPTLTGAGRFLGFVSALAVSGVAGIVVVIAFARKSSAQPLVSIEDFWGGLVVGFSVGYFGFDKFIKVLPSGS